MVAQGFAKLPWHGRLAALRHNMNVPRLSGRTILLVEDEPIIALDIMQTLEDEGAVVVTANSLSGATILVEQDGLSAAIMDFGL